MTKTELRKAIKKEFFTRVCEVYPGTMIDHSEGGRYLITLPHYGDFELSGGNYWEIYSYYIPWARPTEEQDIEHKECLKIEAELQTMLDEIVETITHYYLAHRPITQKIVS